MTKEETLKKLQEYQLKFLGEIDMQVKCDIETRKDQKCTMVVTYCNYTPGFEKKSKLFIHKFYWEQDNTKEFKQMENEIELLRKKYG